MIFKYNHVKNASLIAARGIGFEDIIQCIYSGNVLDIRCHPNIEKYPGQEMFFVKLLEDVYVVPFVREFNGDIFLKTLYPSRKAKKLFFSH